MEKPRVVNKDLIKQQLEQRFNGGEQPTTEPPKQESKPAEQPTETPKVENNQPPAQPAETPQAQPTEVRAAAEQPKVETPKVEMPKSSLKQETQKVEKSEIPQEAFLKYAEENGYIKKDEFKTGHEVVDSILEKWKEGVDWDRQKLHTWTDNIDSYSVDNQTEAMELVKRRLKSEGYNAKQVDFKLKKDYPALFDRDADDSEVEESLMQLSIDAQNAKKNILLEREKYFIPEKNTAQKEQEPVDKAKIVQESLTSMYEDTRQKMGEFYDANLKGYEKEVFSIGDKSIEFKVTPEMEQQVRDDFANYFEFLDKKATAAGENSGAELRKLILVNNYLDDILKTVADQYEAVGKEEIVRDDLKNIPKETNAGSKSQKAVNPAEFTTRHDFLKAQIEQQLNEGRLHKVKR